MLLLLLLVMTYVPADNIRRADGVSYRIVGFEVDPRSISVESLQLKTEKKAAGIIGKEVQSGAKCLFPKDVEVAELHKGREYMVMCEYVYV